MRTMYPGYPPYAAGSGMGLFDSQQQPQPEPEHPLFNVYAPPGYAGIPDLTPEGYREISFDYVYDKVLAASTSYSDQVSVQPDADFVWMAILLSTATGNFSFRLSDSNLYYLSNSNILSALLSSDPSSPTPVFPSIIIPAAGRIGIDITDLSAAPNTVQIVFRGKKRFRVSGR